jgi:hypothetical protein
MRCVLACSWRIPSLRHAELYDKHLLLSPKHLHTKPTDSAMLVTWHESWLRCGDDR